VFVGTVSSRGKPREVAGSVYTPVTFNVAVFLHGQAHRHVTLLTPGGTLPGQTVTSSGSEDQDYRGGGLQLAAAHRSHGELVTEGVCYGTGQVQASMVRDLIAVAANPVIYDQRFAPAAPVDSPNLPFTGPSGLLLLLGLGLALTLSGAGLMTVRKCGDGTRAS
jgi:hypothetical protein